MNRSQDWLDQAERDLSRARLDLQYEFWEWACFTSQQAAGKAVKALLMSRGHSVWGHAITPMLRALTEPGVPVALIEYAQLLDAHYIPTRYPNGFAAGKPADYYNAPKAQEALDAAGEIVRFCKDHLHRSS
ncbi:MAG: HEPN domain-containing protein [Chloroflexi bacterium]|nr:HEPN domain-containing protein [Chloroflexota bacterium]